MKACACSVLLTLALHAVLFFVIGSVLARGTARPVENAPLVISIEFAEQDTPPEIETQALFVPEEAPSQPPPPPEPEPEPEPEPPPPEPEPILTQQENEAAVIEEVEVVEEAVVVGVVDVVGVVEKTRDHADHADNSTTSASTEPSPGAATAPGASSTTSQITTPAARNVIRATYPPNARRRGEEGTVLFELSISEKGLVTEATLITSSGFPELDRAARRAVTTARFTPATQDGKPVPSTLRLPIEFRLVDR